MDMNGSYCCTSAKMQLLSNVSKAAMQTHTVKMPMRLTYEYCASKP